MRARRLTAENFNTPATAGEIGEALRLMRRAQHVNTRIIETWDAQNPYVLTWGKLCGLSSMFLHESPTTLAKQVGATITHVRRDGVVRRHNPAALRTRRAVQLLQWIADNDNAGDDEPAEALAGYLTVCLVADTYNVPRATVAGLVWALRHPEGGAV